MSAPKTADNVEIVVGMTVWTYRHGEDDEPWSGPVDDYDMDDRGAWIDIGREKWSPKQRRPQFVFATHRAALTARLAELDAERARVAAELAKECDQ